MCQTNSPEIDGHGFHELSLRGEPNNAGFAIIGFEKEGVDYKPSVVGGYLSAHRSGATLTGTNLVGAQIHLSHAGNPIYSLRIVDVSGAPVWAAGQQEWVPTYLLEWTTIGTSRWSTLCPRDEKGPWMEAHHSVLFEGDRIDAEKKRVAAQPDESWMNIGCTGSTLAKMFLTGHTHASQQHGFVTSRDERQAMLKMLSGDYCGGGTPYTVGGTPLDWADHNGWMTYIDKKAVLEARWNQDGAACLNRARIAASQYEPGLDVFPDVHASIEAECSLPACDEPDDKFLGYHLLSANPNQNP